MLTAILTMALAAPAPPQRKPAPAPPVFPGRWLMKRSGYPGRLDLRKNGTGVMTANGENPVNITWTWCSRDRALTLTYWSRDRPRRVITWKVLLLDDCYEGRGFFQPDDEIGQSVVLTPLIEYR
jgi:hypothetical protein